MRKMKKNCNLDGFLRNLHLLLLMDDTYIMATTRETCLHKFIIILDFCAEMDIVLLKGGNHLPKIEKM